jgi:hypothetical protein
MMQSPSERGRIQPEFKTPVHDAFEQGATLATKKGRPMGGLCIS